MNYKVHVFEKVKKVSLYYYFKITKRVHRSNTVRQQVPTSKDHGMGGGGEYWGTDPPTLSTHLRLQRGDGLYINKFQRAGRGYGKRSVTMPLILEYPEDYWPSIFGHSELYNVFIHHAV